MSTGHSAENAPQASSRSAIVASSSLHYGWRRSYHLLPGQRLFDAAASGFQRGFHNPLDKFVPAGIAKLAWKVPIYQYCFWLVSYSAKLISKYYLCRHLQVKLLTSQFQIREKQSSFNERIHLGALTCSWSFPGWEFQIPVLYETRCFNQTGHPSRPDPGHGSHPFSRG